MKRTVFSRCQAPTKAAIFDGEIMDWYLYDSPIIIIVYQFKEIHSSSIWKTYAVRVMIMLSTSSFYTWVQVIQREKKLHVRLNTFIL